MRNTRKTVKAQFLEGVYYSVEKLLNNFRDQVFEGKPLRDYCYEGFKRSCRNESYVFNRALEECVDEYEDWDVCLVDYQSRDAWFLQQCPFEPGKIAPTFEKALITTLQKMVISFFGNGDCYEQSIAPDLLRKWHVKKHAKTLLELLLTQGRNEVVLKPPWDEASE